MNSTGKFWWTPSEKIKALSDAESVEQDADVEQTERMLIPAPADPRDDVAAFLTGST